MSKAITGTPAMSDVERAWEAWLKTAGWSITDIKGTFAAGYRSGNSLVSPPAVPGEVGRMNAVEPGKEELVELLAHFERLGIKNRAAYQKALEDSRSALSAPLPEIEGGDKGDGWQPMSTAPTDGKHCILAVKEGPFIYSVQGAFQAGEWNAVHRNNVTPLAWMPNVRLPDEFRTIAITDAGKP